MINGKIDTYRQNLANISGSKFLGMIDMIEHYDENVDIGEIVNEVVKCFSDGIRNAADPLFLRSFSKRKSDNLHKSSGPVWGDDEWRHIKRTFFRVRDRYIRSPSDVNRVMMTDARKHYKYISRNKRIEYDKIQTKKLIDARCKNVKLYWKMLAGKNRSNAPCPISTGEWYNHFMHLANPDGDFFVADADISREVRLLIESDFVDLFQELNIPISTDEIINAIKDLKKWQMRW